MPTGMLLQENLKNEWFNHMVINRDTTILFNKNNFNETLNFAKNLCGNTLPFGVAEITPLNNSDEICEFQNSKFEDNFLLSCNIYVSPKQSTPFFHQFQKQRKMWWRKFSPNPGRYSFSDIQNQSLDILANYDWGFQVLETLSLKPTSFEFKEGRNTFLADCVKSEIVLSSMFLNTLCDAYDEPLFMDKPRPLLHFHRKLAPYRISFAIESSDPSITTELKDLATYLCKQLRDNHVSTLLLPSAAKLTPETLWKQYDQMGIPYNIYLNEGTLRDGIAFLRSRDTTLKEQVHVADMVPYVEKLYKNY